MIPRNPHLSRLKNRYLFPEIIRRKEAFQKSHPEAKLISLSIGDTSLPLLEPVIEKLVQKSLAMGTLEGYEGYGAEIGMKALREKIAQEVYGNQFSADEIFISDGIATDLGRLHFLLGNDLVIGVPDPSYPAYADASLIAGQKECRLLPLTRENHFFFDFDDLKGIDVLFFCSPHNPTGVAATREQMEKLVKKAHEEGFLIVFDAAYSAFVENKHPTSIFAIEGAKEVAIELGSFSKWAGFTGVRLSWSVVPQDLVSSDGAPLIKDWERIVSTCYNGTSVIIQHAGLGLLSQQGLQAARGQMGYYMANTQRLKVALEQKGVAVYGGDCPYLFCDFGIPSSWEGFEWLLHKAHLVTIPGVGFGPSAEGYLRISGFGRTEAIDEAIERIARL